MKYHLAFDLGIACQGCIPPVEAALAEIDISGMGLNDPRIDLPSKTLHIQYDDALTDTSIDEAQLTIINAISDKGISCQHKATSYPNQRHWLFGAAGITAGLGLMMLIFFTGGLSLPMMAALGLSSTALTVIIGYQSIKNAYIHLRYSGTLTMDTLFAISTFVVLSVSLSALFFPGLPMMFEAGLMLFGFRHIGLGIEESLKHHSGVKNTFVDRVPQMLTLENGDAISIDKVVPGTILRLKPGDILPVDGHFGSNQPWISNTIRTGNPRDIQYASNQSINAGAMVSQTNDEAYILYTATSTKQASYLAQLDESLLSAQQNKAPIEQYTTKILQYFIPGVIGIAILSGLLVATFATPALAIQCAAAVLVTACPCTLGMIVPMTMKLGMQKGIDLGVCYQSRQAIEQADKIKQVVFDLNGTLTQGLPRVTKALSIDETPESDIWQALMLLESESQHPMGRMLIEYAKENATNMPISMIKSEAKTHQNGVVATLTNAGVSKQFAVGNRSLMKSLGVQLPTETDMPQIYLCADQKLIASFTIIDPLRPQAKQTIQQLQKQGMEVFILTGSDSATTSYYGRLLNIRRNNQISNQLPEQKQEKIKQLQQAGLVAMVGDGGNDAIALQQSDLGIAMLSPNNDLVTKQQADIIISDQSLLPVSHVFEVAHQTMATLQQNLLFSLSYNAAALLLTGGVLVALGFAMNPAVGAGLMVLQTSLILANTYRLTYQTVLTAEEVTSEVGSSTSALTALETSFGLKPIVSAEPGSTTAQIQTPTSLPTTQPEKAPPEFISHSAC